MIKLLEVSLITMIILLSEGISGQSLERSVIGSFGMSELNSSYQLSITGGESVVSYHKNSSYQLTQGFQQYNPDIWATSIEKEISQEFRVYPNPANNFIYINPSENHKVQIFNMMGQLELISQNRTKIDISHLPSGFYIIRVSSNNGTESSIKLQKL
jgi:hypothetical protein